MLLDNENYTHEQKIIVPTSLFLRWYLMAFAFMFITTYYFLSFLFFEPLNLVLFGVVLSLVAGGYFFNLYSHISTNRIAIRGGYLILINHDKEYCDLEITYEQNNVSIKSTSKKIFVVIFKKSENEEICEWIFKNSNVNPTKYYGFSGSLLIHYFFQNIFFFVLEGMRFILLVVGVLSFLFWIAGVKL